jgi:hypothetical protein
MYLTKNQKEGTCGLRAAPFGWHNYRSNNLIVCGYVNADKLMLARLANTVLKLRQAGFAGAEFRSICYAGKPSVSVQWLLSVARCSPDPRNFDGRSRSPLWVSFITKIPPTLLNDTMKGEYLGDESCVDPPLALASLNVWQDDVRVSKKWNRIIINW